MERTPAPLEPDGGITRTDLELVIRRAAELYTREAEASEQLSEAEVLRIAEELGLPARHVRQALYELPAQRAPANRIGRLYGPAHAQATRVVPGSAVATMDRLEAYLATREYLRLVRRQGHRAAFTPAEDAISSMARAVRRPQRHWLIARSRRVLLEVRPMPDEQSHVRLDLDLEPQRRRSLIGGLVGGVAVGLPVAALLGLPAGGMVFDIAGGPAGTIAAISAGAAGLGGTVAAGLGIARARFRSRLDAARLELASLLDRLEAGSSLDPPPAPWLRGLRHRISRSLGAPGGTGELPGP